MVFGNEDASNLDDLGATTKGRVGLLSKLPLLSPNNVCMPQFMDEEGEHGYSEEEDHSYSRL